MARYELVLPAMGEGIIEATITHWLVSNGQQVSIDQPLVEVATDKVDSEIPSPVEGTMVRLVYREGEIPRVGEVIALIETDTSGSAPVDDQEVLPTRDYKTVLPEKTNKMVEDQQSSATLQHADRVCITPLVRLLAKQRGLSPVDLTQMHGTGLNGRITKEDINHFISTGQQGNARYGRELGGDELMAEYDRPAQETDAGPDDEIVEMDRMRRIIAGHMIRSRRIAPHVTSFLEADITALADWREKNKAAFLENEKAKLTYTPVFIEVVAKALKEFPRINVSVSGDSIVVKKNINIGIATALPDGNLIVPVIRNADSEDLGSLARIVVDLANRARGNTLLPAEIKGGTFTITNIGQYNSLTGTPIINQPESAILAVGTITKKPWAVKTPDGYGLAIRDITMLSLTYDHRVIDGAMGGSFLSRIVWHLEHFDVNRE